jgi:hypothetical protein
MLPGGPSRDVAMMCTMEPTYEVVWPKSPRGVQSRRPAPRLDDLNAKRVAFLWDYLFRGDEIFPVLEAELTARFPGVEIVGYEVFGNTHGSDEKEMVAGLPEGLTQRHIDAVVSAMGC